MLRASLFAVMVPALLIGRPAAAQADALCAHDNVAAWLAAGHELLQQCQMGAPQAAAAAVMALEGPCQCGDQAACVGLAAALQWCPGCAGAAERAMALYERACAQHSAVACLNLGMERERLARQTRDAAQMAKAGALYEAACEGGEPQGCGWAGAMLLGARRDNAKAVALLNRACDAGEVAACQELAEAYALEMPGVPKDGAAAALARKRACMAGADSACPRPTEARATDE